MSYDILLEPNLDLPESSSHVTGIEIIAQRVHIRLGMFIGEWLLDKSKGIDFVSWFTQKMTKLRLVNFGETLRIEIISTPGVARVENYSCVLDDKTVRCSGDVIADDGTSFAFQLDPSAPSGGDNASPLFLYQLNKSGPISPL